MPSIDRTLPRRASKLVARERLLIIVELAGRNRWLSAVAITRYGKTPSEWTQTRFPAS